MFGVKVSPEVGEGYSCKETGGSGVPWGVCISILVLLGDEYE